MTQHIPQPPFPIPPHPPHPPTPEPPPEVDVIAQLRDTVETQARTIRYLLANYNDLLAKVEAEEQPEPAVTTVITALGAPQTFTATQAIPNGFWQVPATTELTFGTVPQTFTTISLIYADGTHVTATAAATLTPITFTLSPA